MNSEIKHQAYRIPTALRCTPVKASPQARCARSVWLPLLLTVMLGHAPEAGAGTGTSEKEQVLAVVSALFDAMREKDAGALEALFLPEARLGTRAVGDWIGQIATSTAYLDEVTFEETVLIDAQLAMAWTPYNLFVDGKFHHCGVDLFMLRRIDGVWKILQLDDTRRKDGCNADRRG